MRIYDPTGNAGALIGAHWPQATIHSQRLAERYDAAVIAGPLRPAELDLLLWQCGEAVRPDGRVILCLPEQPTGVAVTRQLDVAKAALRHGRVEAFERSDDGQIVASLIPRKRCGTLAIWTGWAIGPWHPSDIVERGLGGSETAAWRLAEEFAAIGYAVTLYGQFEREGLVEDVLLRDFRHFDPGERLDVFVGFRDARRFDEPVNAGASFLWLEDLPGQEATTPERVANIDRICAVSHDHRDKVLAFYPWLDPDKVVACRNGITHEFFAGEQPERELRVVYSSSPDRGLSMLLEVWPQVRERVPGAELLSTYSRWYDICASTFEQAKGPHEALLEQFDATDGARRLPGGMGQRDLATLLRSSLVWAHPSWFAAGEQKFHETNCIACQEAQAAGCVVVASNWGALSEFVRHGFLIDGDPADPESGWRERFVDALVEGLTNPQLQREAQERGPVAVADLDWRGAAEQLAALFPRVALAKAADADVPWADALNTLADAADGSAEGGELLNEAWTRQHTP